MIGVDTNVLLRYLTGDDAAQSARARRAIERAEGRGETIFVSLPVLCELAWTLAGRRYRLSAEEIAGVVEGLLEVVSFEIQERDAVRGAVEDLRRFGETLPDHLIGRLGARAGCTSTLSFDTRLEPSPHFDVLGPR